MNIIGSTLRAVIVAHLAEPSLLISEDPGLNPAIGKIFILNIFTVYCWKDENTEKEDGIGQLAFKKQK